MRGTERYQERLLIDPEERAYLERTLDDKDVLIDRFVGPRRRLLEKLRGER